ncbi:MAG TPA: amidohydrolase family protein [Phycisphaerae bacterium]|nr:amidohydrolase family protein [Phycisphaerae bacterium]
MIVDCHVHFDGVGLYDQMIEDQRRTGVDRFNIVITPQTHRRQGPDRLAAALWVKRKHPDSVYVFGNLDYSGLFEPGADAPAVPLVEQLDRLIDLGCDGLKMLCGKPDTRKEIGRALDGELYEPLLGRLEETQFPLLWHIGDPPEFWSPDTVPLWAKQQKWWYDESTPPKAQIDREALGAFARHPKLRVILAHFFFLSDDLSAAERFLEEHPNICLDLAPGVEMYHNFTRQHAAARELFLRHADRILYGTDIGAGRHCTGPKRGWMVRHWLETDDEFDVPDDPLMTPDERPALKGIALPADALEKIYAANFHRVLRRDTPRPLNGTAADALIAEADV